MNVEQITKEKWKVTERGQELLEKKGSKVD